VRFRSHRPNQRPGQSSSHLSQSVCPPAKESACSTPSSTPAHSSRATPSGSATIVRREDTRYSCVLCHRAVLHPRTHLREHKDHKGLYEDDPDKSEEYVDQTKHLVYLPTDDELDTMLQNFHSYLTRIGKADEDPAVATSVVKKVQRIICDLLRNKQYTPAALRGLLTIDDRQHGLLWAYHLGTCRDKSLKSSTIGGYIVALDYFVKFLIENLALIKGALTKGEGKDLCERLKRCKESLSRRRGAEDRQRRGTEIGKYCDPSRFGRFLISDEFRRATGLVAAAATQPNLCTEENLVLIRDVLMLCLLITNARRTGDLINMTLTEFERAHASESGAGDHVVFVNFHKT